MPTHAEAMPTQPAPADRGADDWFRQRRGFQLEIARRIMGVKELDDDTMLAWVSAGHAKRFADIVDAATDAGQETRRLIAEDRATALDRVQQQMTLH